MLVLFSDLVEWCDSHGHAVLDLTVDPIKKTISTECGYGLYFEEQYWPTFFHHDVGPLYFIFL